jgi:predicted nucleic-acid-binding protein
MAQAMIGIDTNILVRYLVQDDEEQSVLVNALFAQARPNNRLFVSTFVLVETIWVLSSVYGTALNDIGESLARLCNSQRVSVQDVETVKGVLEAGLDKDYMDKLVAESARRQGCSPFLTFDRRLSKELDDVTLLDSSSLDKPN